MNTPTIIIITIITVVILVKGYINLLLLEKEQPYDNPILYFLWVVFNIMIGILIIFFALLEMNN